MRQLALETFLGPIGMLGFQSIPLPPSYLASQFGAKFRGHLHRVWQVERERWRRGIHAQNVHWMAASLNPDRDSRQLLIAANLR